MWERIRVSASHPLVGTWRYVDAKLDGKSTRPNGKGMIYYAPSGAMMCQVSPGNDVKRAGAKPTPDEALAALDGHIAYFGTYSIDEARADRDASSARQRAAGDTADLVRKFTIEGDKLTLNPAGTNYFVHWERMK